MMKHFAVRPNSKCFVVDLNRNSVEVKLSGDRHWYFDESVLESNRPLYADASFRIYIEGSEFDYFDVYKKDVEVLIPHAPRRFFARQP